MTEQPKTLTQKVNPQAAGGAIAGAVLAGFLIESVREFTSYELSLAWSQSFTACLTFLSVRFWPKIWSGVSHNP